MECSIHDCVWYVELLFVLGAVGATGGIIIVTAQVGVWIKNIGDAIISHHKEDDEPEAPDENPQ